MWKRSKYFFWLQEINKIVVVPYWWVFLTIFVLWVPFLRVWWWIFIPLFLSIELKIIYLWWIGWDYQYAKTKWVMLELIPPKEAVTPYRAMEDVFSTVWPVYDQGNWRERFCEGELGEWPYWFSFEIASFEGKIHYYARVMAQHRTMMESALYSHFPDIEIEEVPDYTKNVPQNIPNEEWDLYGEDFTLIYPDPLPIKTLGKFFEPSGEFLTSEKKRIDPIMSLLESLSQLGSGEQFWFQCIAVPTSSYEDPEVYENAKKLILKTAKRPVKKEITFFEELSSVFRNIALGPKKEGSGYVWDEPKTGGESGPILPLTEGENEIISEIEKKISRPLYRAAIRGVYIAKRENWSPANRVLTRAYSAHFTTTNLNEIRFTGETRPKIHYLMRKRRALYRAKRMMRNAVMRFPSYFPYRGPYTCLLGAEEMATLFHFPIKVSGLVKQAMRAIEHKKAAPPPDLPI